MMADARGVKCHYFPCFIQKCEVGVSSRKTPASVTTVFTKKKIIVQKIQPLLESAIYAISTLLVIHLKIVS